MSTALATAPLRRPTSPNARPHVEQAPSIEIVPGRDQRRARPKVVYASVVIGGIGALMLSQLMMSIALSDGAYTIDSLQSQQKEQSRVVQQLNEELGTLSSPQNLAANAEALGMVQNTNPVWLRMSDGAVVGTPAAAAAGAGVLGATGSQVPNELLSNVPLVTGADSAAAQASATPEQPAPQAGGAELPLQAPTTR